MLKLMEVGSLQWWTEKHTQGLENGLLAKKIEMEPITPDREEENELSEKQEVNVTARKILDEDRLSRNQE